MRVRVVRTPGEQEADITECFRKCYLPRGEGSVKTMTKIAQSFGPFPEKTPLKPRITGTVDRDAYRVEKVIFESQPKHYVTAALFLPDPARHKPPYPGVLVPCGHSANGKALEVYRWVQFCPGVRTDVEGPRHAAVVDVDDPPPVCVEDRRLIARPAGELGSILIHGAGSVRVGTGWAFRSGRGGLGSGRRQDRVPGLRWLSDSG